MLPIEAGYYRYPDLLDGSIYIEHIAEIQDAMARSAENKDRARMAMEAKA